MSALPTLIIDVDTNTHNVKRACDNLSGWVKNVKADFERIEAELAANRRAADDEKARLLREIEQIRREQREAEIKLADVRRELKREEREVGQHKARLLRDIEQYEAARQ
jgi:hypothetical protein